MTAPTVKTKDRNMMQRFRPMKSGKKPEGSEPTMQPRENMAVRQAVGRKDRGGIRERKGRTSWREWLNDVDRGQVASLDSNFSPRLIAISMSLSAIEALDESPVRVLGHRIHRPRSSPPRPSPVPRPHSRAY